mgnify:FL=1
MKLPEKESLVKQTILVLQEMMHTGQIASPIPGERALSRDLQIGRDTLRAALIELTKTGWISESAQGKRREILKTSKPVNASKKAQNRVIFICPQRLEEFPRVMLVELNSLRSLLAKRGITVDVINPAIFNTAQPGKRLQQLLADYPANAWVLYRCPEPVQRWFQENKIPCVVRGYPHPNISLPFLDEDWHAAAFHAGSRLISNGHKSIGILLPNISLAGLQAAEDGLKDAVAKVDDSYSYQVIRENHDLTSTVQSMQKALASPTPPSAIIATRSRHILNLVSWLATFGYSIPEHLSVVALCHEPWFDELYSPISHYSSSPEAMSKNLSKQVRHLLNGTPIPAKNSLIFPELREGQSIKNLTQKV